MTQPSIPAAVFRGGTSKGVYVEREALPDDEGAWDDLLLGLFGSPDPMQLDGIGGSHSVTSKAMVVSASDHPEVDVSYRFGQVGIEEPIVDWGGNCGNLTFAIGPFALERGVVTGEDGSGDGESGERDGDDGNDGEAGRVELVLENANTDTVVEQSVPVDSAGRPRYAGDFHVAGVPRPGARIRSRFLDPAGSMTTGMLPTGNRIDTLSLPSGDTIEASLVDVTNPCVFVRALEVGLAATERPGKIDADPGLLKRLEAIRSAACARLGFVEEAADATTESPGVPKMVVVGERQSYETVGGESVAPGEYDLLARIMSMGSAHHAYAVSGAMCTAAATLLPGTIPAAFLAADATETTDGTGTLGATDTARDSPGTETITIGHPKGTMRVGVGIDGEDVTHAFVDRTARLLMDGRLYEPES